MSYVHWREKWAIKCLVKCYHLHGLHFNVAFPLKQIAVVNFTFSWPFLGSFTGRWCFCRQAIGGWRQQLVNSAWPWISALPDYKLLACLTRTHCRELFPPRLLCWEDKSVCFVILKSWVVSHVSPLCVRTTALAGEHTVCVAVAPPWCERIG